MRNSSPSFESGVLLNGKYQLDAKLGAGGMGAVYSARNTLLDAPVAIKVLHPSATPRPDLARRFMQEARSAAQVRHPNIVGILDIGQDESSGALFIVQELLHGVDLKHHLTNSGPLSPVESLDLLVPVMRALAFAHSRGIVHRDLKPDNIFLAETPEGVVPKIIDFGIAKVVDDQGESVGMTKTSQVLGTPYFMCPEQARGDRAVDHRADIWSIGVVLYHALTKRYPHEGTTVNLIITNIIARLPTPITHFAPELPVPLVALIDSALVYDPDQRCPSMDALALAARRCRDALVAPAAPRPLPVEPHRAASPTRSEDLAAPGGATVAPLVVSTEVPARSTMRSSLLVVAGLALLLVAALAGFVSARGDHTSTAAARPPAPSPVAPPRVPLTPVLERAPATPPLVAAPPALRPPPTMPAATAQAPIPSQRPTTQAARASAQRLAHGVEGAATQVPPVHRPATPTRTRQSRSPARNANPFY